MKLPILETQRLLLRPLAESDAKDLYEYAKLEQVGPNAGWEPHTSISDSYKFISLLKEPKTERHPILFAIEYKEDEKMIGTIDFHDYNRFIKQVEVGYALNPNYWGLGLVVEALRQLLSFGFERMDINRVQIMHDPKNIASRRVIEKVDFRFEGVLRDRIKNVDGTFSEANIYSILRNEFLRKRLSWQFDFESALFNYLKSHHHNFYHWFFNLGYLERSLMDKWGYDEVVERIFTKYHYLAVVKNKETQAVMKYYLDEKTYLAQLEGMKLLSTISVPIIHQCDDDYVMLMEHAAPGVSLNTVGDDQAETKIFIDLIKREKYQLPQTYEKHQSMWLTTLKKHVHLEGVQLAHDLMAAIMKSKNEVLIHGDMHHENIIKYGYDWKVIDPFGIVAHPYFEICSFLKNNLNHKHLEEQLVDRVELISESLGYKKKMLYEATYVYFVLSNLWHLEDDGQMSFEMNHLIEIVRKQLGGYKL